MGSLPPIVMKPKKRKKEKTLSPKLHHGTHKHMLYSFPELSMLLFLPSIQHVFLYHFQSLILNPNKEAVDSKIDLYNITAKQNSIL